MMGRVARTVELVRQLNEQLEEQQINLASLQVSFMHIGNVTMVTVVL
jgi:hypothetical protein